MCTFDLQTIKYLSPSLGLQLNVVKCELGRATFSGNSSFDPWYRTKWHHATWHPLSTAAIVQSVHSKLEALGRLTSHLRCLDAHDAIYHLRNCLSIRKLHNLLRTSKQEVSWKRLSDFRSSPSATWRWKNPFGPRQHYQCQGVISALANRWATLYQHSLLHHMPVRAWYRLFYPLGSQVLIHLWVRLGGERTISTSTWWDKKAAMLWGFGSHQ